MQRRQFCQKRGTNASVRNVPDQPVEMPGLPDDAVDALFSGLNSFSNLSLAVSGGADSLCLLVLFGEWSRRVSWKGRAEVIVVNHGLRQESDAEARFVVDVAKRSGYAASVLRWEGEKPQSNVQEAARTARYCLIARRMKATGAEALLLGHHLDDQAETFLDRLTRGSGISGLSAMAADERDGPEGLRLLRPFLGVRKLRLEASLRERGQDWCTDPSNLDMKYKRSRLRNILGLLNEEGLSVERVAETAAHIRRSRDALEFAVRDIVSRKVEFHPAGPARLNREVFAALPDDLRLRFLNEIMTHVTGVRARPRLAKLQSLDAALNCGESLRQSLCGTMFEAGAETIWCWREPGRVPPMTLSEFDRQGIWDHRFAYSVLADRQSIDEPDGLRLGPLCHAPAGTADFVWPEGWPKAAFDCSPVVWSPDGLIFTQSASLPVQPGKNNHSCTLDLARLPIRGKLSDNSRDIGDVCGEI